MARTQGAKRMMVIGKATAWTGLVSELLYLAITLIAIRIPLATNVPWMAIERARDLFVGLGVLALGIGTVFWLGGWVIAGFLE